MGRGRQKAKQTKVARDLKYSNTSLDTSALERELGSHPAHLGGHPANPPVVEDDDEEDDQYAAYASYNEDEDDEPAGGYASRSSRR
jgi:hypothetical protein